MKLYNTLSKKIEDFVPLNDKKVGIYSCGPTVYDHAHIGNLSSFVYVDTLRRVLTVDGYEVHHVMNLTDVDDKTIKRSQAEDHNLDARQALRSLTERFGHIFMEDMHAIGNDTSALEFKKATEHIEQMQNIITKLVHAGIAYIAEDGVYFSIEAYKKAGKTYGQLVHITEASTSEARIHNDEYDKDSAHDFALWKLQKDAEPAWEYEIDGQQLDGRPGWHIECSAMSEAALGLPFDIHTGGIDLMFPHHENEIAQSTALSDNPLMAKFFVHNEHILVDGKKMSKSAGNFFTLEDIRAKGFDPLAFRLLVLQSHYRSQSNFTWESLEAAQNFLHRLYAFADLRFQLQNVPSWLQGNTTTQSIMNELTDDLKTPIALSHLSALMNKAEEEFISHDDEDTFVNTLKTLDDLFGFKLLERQDLTQDQKTLLAAREQARNEKNWTHSDEMRDQLKKQGIVVRDTRLGQIWERA